MTQDASESMLATQDAFAEPTSVSEEQLDQIRLLGDGSATMEDVFGFRMVASGDGLDFYFTRQHESSMRNYVRDLQKGQSVLGSHDVNTFSYGSSYGATLENADPTSPIYEAAFYRQYSDRPELATTRYVVGDYFLVRGVTLNGQPTDDLIKAMRIGGIRKASISFTVGKYQCGLDGKDMLQSFFGPAPNSDEGCQHFPGVNYKKEGVAWAWMMDSDLMETSLVYKNASPSAMLVRKATELAVRGMLPTTELARVEERLQRRLPNFDRTVYPAANLEGLMTTERTETTVETTVETIEEQVDTPDTPEGGITQESPTETPPPEPPDEPEEVRQIRQSWSQAQTRDAAIAELLGGPVTLEAIRSLKQGADLGSALYAVKVDEAVQARITAQGADSFDSAKFRQILIGMRDVEYVQSEIASYTGQKQKAFTAGRTVAPLATPELPEPGPSSRSDSESSSLLAGVVKNSRSQRKPAGR